MKRLSVAMSILLPVFICVSIGAAPAVSKTLELANLSPMSGGAAAWGIAADRGARIWVDEINGKGGLKVGTETYTLKVITMDHRYVPGEALGAARKVVHDGIRFAVGVGAGVMPAMQPVLEQSKVIYMGCMGAGVEFTNGKCPYTFRIQPSSDLIYHTFLPRFAEMLGPMKAAFIHNNDQLGRADSRVQTKVINERKLPIEKLTEFIERDAVDFSPVITRLMAKKVDFILNELTPAQGATFIKQAWELGYRGRMARICAPISIEKLLEVAGKEALDGFINATNWPQGHYPTQEFEKLHSEYLSRYKEEPILNGFWVHSALEFLGLALEEAGTIDTERVAKVMYDLETKTVLGPTSMVGKSLGYGIDTTISFNMPFCEVADGQLKLIEVVRYKQ
jgi:branched-chain amino acid transport system substrate-binding protein